MRVLKRGKRGKRGVYDALFPRFSYFSWVASKIGNNRLLALIQRDSLASSFVRFCVSNDSYLIDSFARWLHTGILSVSLAFDSAVAMTGDLITLQSATTTLTADDGTDSDAVWNNSGGLAVDHHCSDEACFNHDL